MLTGIYNHGGTCSENFPYVCGYGPVMIGLHGGLGRSGGYCSLLITLCGFEMFYLYWN